MSHTLFVLLVFIFVAFAAEDVAPEPKRYPQDFPNIPQFDCPKLPPPPPASNVNKLHPGNIKVVMAVGDSITAGFGMQSGRFWHLLDLVEYRGSSFSIGGDKDQLTIPNFLKNYNPDIIGASEGWSLPLDAIKWEGHIIQPWEPEVTHLNGAQSGAQIDAIPAQIDYITDQIMTTYNSSIDMEKDWKLMTVFIGANNICPSCDNGTRSHPDYYEQQLDLLLAKIHKQLPRTFVNVVAMFNISQVWRIAMQSTYCKFMWRTFCAHECSCMTGGTELDRQKMDWTSVEFNKRIYKVASKWQQKNIPTFTVKVQPFLENLVIPNDVGINFLSALDCFHPSTWANIAFASGLWNSMMTPEPLKQKAIDVDNISFICPTPDTVLN